VKEIKELIIALEKCIPTLDSALLHARFPRNMHKETVLNWLYESLSEQSLMVYEEWSEYFGWLPELRPLSTVSLVEEPSNFISSLINDIDWSIVDIDPYEFQYFIPWLEHINFYLKPHGLRLVDLLPFENAYIICIRDDDALLQQLCNCLNVWEIDINERDALDRPQTAERIASYIANDDV